MSVQAVFDKLAPERKRIVVFAGAALIALGVATATVKLTQPKDSAGSLQTRAQKPSISPLMAGRELKLGTEALGKRLDDLEQTQKELRNENEDLKKEIQSKDTAPRIDGIALPGVTPETDPLAEVEARIQGKKGAGAHARLNTLTPPNNPINVSPDGSLIPGLQPTQSASPDAPTAFVPKPPAFKIRSAADAKDPASTAASKAGNITGVSTQTAGKATGVAANAREHPEEVEQILPAGSLLSGVGITGIDAPTANQARRDPIPMLIRVKDQAILPGRFRMDLRECFLIASGWGDLSSERVYLRAETLSCVRDDGKVIETDIDAVAQGSDGKAGVRGRLVHKNGQMIANSLMTGFLSGFSSALGPSAVPSVQIAPSNSTTYQSPNLGEVARIGAFSGTGSAMGKVADYYLEMARSIFPVIEIDAGLQVDFITLHGQKLKLGLNSRGGGLHAQPPALVRNPFVKR